MVSAGFKGFLQYRLFLCSFLGIGRGNVAGLIESTALELDNHPYNFSLYFRNFISSISSILTQAVALRKPFGNTFDSPLVLLAEGAKTKVLSLKLVFSLLSLYCISPSVSGSKLSYVKL